MSKLTVAAFLALLTASAWLGYSLVESERKASDDAAKMKRALNEAHDEVQAVREAFEYLSIWGKGIGMMQEHCRRKEGSSLHTAMFELAEDGKPKRGGMRCYPRVTGT